MKLSDFYYDLPKELIAQCPAQKRDESKLLVLHRNTGVVEHRAFKDIIKYLDPEDTLILNNTRVVPARLWGKKETGGKIEALLLNPAQGQALKAGGEYEALLKPARGCKPGSKIIFADGKLTAEISKIENGRRFLKFHCSESLYAILRKSGEMPLPPYIKRGTVDSDTERYQTVYASMDGAVAAPTAGLHFTKGLLDSIFEKGAGVEYVTLHVGYGTFKPVSVENIIEHKMEKEYFEIEERVIDKLKNKKGRVVAVGTTSCRVLETVAAKFTLPAAQGAAATTCMAKQALRLQKNWTDLFIYPGYEFKAVDGLLTNFHLPKTTLLMLVAAFCGRELMFKAYEEAIREKYRFYSYGDAMLIV